MYTDSKANGGAVNAGPYVIMPAMSNPAAAGAVLEIVVRMAYDLEADDLMETTHDRAYHGGGLYDEFAALLSLSLGIRCQSGGPIRRWYPESDHWGVHVEFDHTRPYLAVSGARGQILPGHPKHFTLEQAESLLTAYGTLTSTHATAVIRAARLYQQALWISETDPNQAWILLVSAIEVAANNYARVPKSPFTRIEMAWPELAATLSSVPHDTRDEISRIIAPTIKVAAKVLAFFEEFLPGPPSARPAVYDQVDWDKMMDHVGLIYRYRSNSLHEGNPFPYPMCEAPRTDSNGVASEKPMGHATQVGGSSWLAEDVPFLLHVFEYITRQSLQAWWKARAA